MSFYTNSILKLKELFQEMTSTKSRRRISNEEEGVLEALPPEMPPEKDGRWSELPPELLMDVIERVEKREVSWPSRRDVVACASVCESWRGVTKEVVRLPEECSLITFPSSLKQPGPKENPIQCYIRRDRATMTYRLYLGLSPGENGKFLLAACKMKHATRTDYIISLAMDDFSRASIPYVGKLRSNFLGTKFTVYDNLPHVPVLTNNHSNRVLHSSQISSRPAAGNYHIATITYELNVLRTRGPRKMMCTLHSISKSAVQDDLQDIDHQLSDLSVSKHNDRLSQFSSTNLVEIPKEPLVLKTKSPRWHEQLQCWCLNFKGRVTVASVKNFQLVASIGPAHENSPLPAEQDTVILQFGKIGKDIFTMDYRYPISAFQAFAICLSSFDTKPGSNMPGIAQAIAFHGKRVKLAVLQHINAKQRMAWSNLFSATSTSNTPHHGLENTTVAEILKTKGDNDAGTVYWCRTDDLVYDAVKNMTQNNIGALVVVKPGDEKLVEGIITERDYLRKIIVQGRSSKATKVGDIMTDENKLVTVSTDTNILQAMQLMTDKHIRHVPVVDQKVVGLISIVDVVQAVLEQQQEEVKRLNAFIKGDYY